MPEFLVVRRSPPSEASEEETMSRDFDFETEFKRSHFIMIGHGDGRVTAHVMGYGALSLRVFEDCGEFLADHLENWEWSDESPSQPYYLHLPFEAEGLTIVRLGDAAVSSIFRSDPDAANCELIAQTLEGLHLQKWNIMSIEREGYVISPQMRDEVITYLRGSALTGKDD